MARLSLILPANRSAWESLGRFYEIRANRGTQWMIAGRRHIHADTGRIHCRDDSKKGGTGIELATFGGDKLATINEHDWSARGWGKVHVPAVTFWDFFTPRDPAGSAALRAITTDTARGLFAGTAPPGVTHPVLMQGIAEIVRCVVCIRTGEWPARLKDAEEIDVVEQQLAGSTLVDEEARQAAIAGAKEIDEVARTRGMRDKA